MKQTDYEDAIDRDAIANETDKESLRVMLLSEMHFTGEDYDSKREDYIIERLIELEAVEIGLTPEEMLKDFNENYRCNICNEEMESDSLNEPKINSKLSTKEFQNTKRKRTSILKKTINIAAGLSLLIIAMLLFGSNEAVAEIPIFKPIVEWTDDVFKITYTGKRLSEEEKEKASEKVKEAKEIVTSLTENGERCFESLEDVEVYYDVSVMKLAYLPEGFEIRDIKVTVSPKNDKPLNLILRCDNAETEEYITFLVIFVSEGMPIAVNTEKNLDEVQLYMVDNTEFYIYSNVKWHNVSWAYDNKSYSMSANISEEEVQKILRYIY